MSRTDSPPATTRADETVRTILDRATRRAQSVSMRCQANTVRMPEAGTTDRIDPTRVARLRPTPRDLKRDDAYEAGLAAVIGDESNARRAG